MPLVQSNLLIVESSRCGAASSPAEILTFLPRVKEGQGEGRGTWAWGEGLMDLARCASRAWTDCWGCQAALQEHEAEVSGWLSTACGQRALHLPHAVRAPGAARDVAAGRDTARHSRAQS